MGRGHHSRAVCGIVVATALSCTTSLSVPDDTHISCEADAECPSGWVCDAIAGQCLVAKYLQGIPCDADTECDDALFCNGVETCVAGFCSPGSGPCVAAFACVLSDCLEEADSCRVTVDHNFCESGTYCEPTVGCAPGQGCESATDCQDSSTCNGAEDCVGGRCIAGPAPVTNDDLACTIDGCDDARLDLGLESVYHLSLTSNDGNACTTEGGAVGICVSRKGGCAVSECGDAIVDPDLSEFCDDGPGQGEGACLDDCSGIQKCGDSVVNGDETCDDGDFQDTGNGCAANCQANSTCGNGVVEAAVEQCEDGNTNSGDGCFDCRLEPGFICHSKRPPCMTVVDDCTGKPDYTACEVDTSPTDGFDLWYDICLRGECCSGLRCRHTGPTFPPPDTGLTACSDNDVNITCPDLSTCDTSPFCGQDAQYGWDMTHAQTERYVRDLSSPEEPVVTDTITGLVWQGCILGTSGSICTTGTAVEGPWYLAFSQCENLVWGGLDQWRLPDIFELTSLFKYDNDPALDRTALPSYPSTPSNAWSATFANDDGNVEAWVAGFGGGMVSRGGVGNRIAAVTYNAHVRCVHGMKSPMPAQRYTRDTSMTGEPMVSDTVSGLTWQGCAAGLSGDGCEVGTTGTYDTWQAALAYCETLAWAGRSDWRLPNFHELHGIKVMAPPSEPHIDLTVFPNIPFWPDSRSPVPYFHTGFWTSTSRGADPRFAYMTTFGSGIAGKVDKDPSIFPSVVNALCVRGGM